MWGVGGKFGTSAAVGIVLPPSAQMVEKQGWSYVSRPNQLLRGAHQQQCEITSLAFSQVGVGWVGCAALLLQVDARWGCEPGGLGGWCRCHVEVIGDCKGHPHSGTLLRVVVTGVLTGVVK